MKISQPFIIIIICLLLFMIIIRFRQSSKVKNIMEGIEFFDNQQNKIVENDPTFADYYSSGDWTTSMTTLSNDDIPNNLMTIDQDNKKIFFPKIENNKYFNGEEYDIILSKGMNIVANSKSTNLVLSLTFINIAINTNYGDNKLIMTADLPMCEVRFTNNDKPFFSYMSYKILNKSAPVEGQLNTIIKNKAYSLAPPIDKYDYNTYLKIISSSYSIDETYDGNNPKTGEKYNFYNSIKIELDYGTPNTDYTNFYNKYSKNFAFALAREFTTPTGSTIRTRICPLTYPSDIDNKYYGFPPGKNGKIAKYLIIQAPKDDQTKIDYKLYTPKSVVIYFYKLINSDINYNFSTNKAIQLDTQIMKYQRGGDAMFNNGPLVDHMEYFTKYINNNFELVHFKTVFTPDPFAPVKVPISDLFNL